MRTRAVLLLRRQRLFLLARPVRLYSTPPPAFDTLSTSLKGLAEDLESTQPCFGARGDEVEVLYGPEEFYKRLLVSLQKSALTVAIDQTGKTANHHLNAVHWR